MASEVEKVIEKNKSNTNVQISQVEDKAQKSENTSDNTQGENGIISDGQKREALISDIKTATLKQTILLALALFTLTTIVLIIWFYALVRYDKKLQTEFTVTWNAPPNLSLKSGPSSFWYDKQTKELHYRGLIDDKLKEELISLTNVNQDSEPQLQKAVRDYSEAIDKLAYQSNEAAERLIAYLLFLGGLSGMLGTQLRSMTNFVGIACFKNQLDVSRWWPWYAIRPMVGFLLGVILVLIIEAGLFSIGETKPIGTNWWLAVAFLAGFGATDFTDRLRLLSKTLFGNSSPSDSADRKGTSATKS